MTVTSRAVAAYLAEKGLTDGEFAAIVGVSGELVRLWRHGHREVTAKRAVAVSKVTGIPLHQLRPDLWEPPPHTAPKPRSKRAGPGKVVKSRTSPRVTSNAKPGAAKPAPGRGRIPASPEPAPDDVADAAD